MAVHSPEEIAPFSRETSPEGLVSGVLSTSLLPPFGKTNELSRFLSDFGTGKSIFTAFWSSAGVMLFPNALIENIGGLRQGVDCDSAGPQPPTESSA